ncbi:MAG: hypothetical protein IKG56_00845 [Clostridia bacterium]|nr:hypothetical protein [Clostridia bacterium]
MNFNKCVRCGSFFASSDNICPNCQHKDKVDMISIRNYLANNELPQNIEMLSSQSGVSVKNINRYLKTKEFSDIKESFFNANPSNIGTSL